MAGIELKWNSLASLQKGEIDKLADGISGIYRLSYRHPDGNAYVNFVSKCDDLKEALLKHISNEETNTCIRGFLQSSTCYFKFAQIQDPKEKEIAYGLLYKVYQPTCNIDKPVADENFTININ